MATSIPSNLDVIIFPDWAEGIGDPLRHVFSFLLLPELLRCAAVCKAWRNIAYDDVYYQDLVKRINKKFFTYKPDDEFLPFITREKFLKDLKEMISTYPKSESLEDCLRDRWVYEITTDWGYDNDCDGQDIKKLSPQQILDNFQILYRTVCAFYSSKRSQLAYYEENEETDSFFMSRRHETAARITALVGDIILFKKALELTRKDIEACPKEDAQSYMEEILPDIAFMAARGKQAKIGALLGEAYYENALNQIALQLLSPLDLELLVVFGEMVARIHGATDMTETPYHDKDASIDDTNKVDELLEETSSADALIANDHSLPLDLELSAYFDKKETAPLDSELTEKPSVSSNNNKRTLADEPDAADNKKRKTEHSTEMPYLDEDAGMEDINDQTQP